MDLYGFVLALLALIVVLVVGTQTLRLLVARAEEKTAKARRMAALAKKSAAVRRGKPRREVEEDEDEDEDDQDEVDQFFDLIDSNPLAAGVAQGFARQHGVDLEAVRRREPAALLKAQAAIQAMGQQQQQAPGQVYL